MAFSGYLSLPVVLWNLAMHIAMIVVLFNIISIKRWAVYAFGGIQVANVAVLTLFFRSDFFTSSFVAVLLCLLLTALFCLKKDGVSAWRLFFPKIEKEEDDEPACLDEIESVVEEEKGGEGIFVPKSSVDKENEDNKTRKPETSTIQDNDLLKSLESLPLKEDGGIDYEQMSTIQQFAYTYKTESLEIALKDLNADIKVLEKSIAKAKKELSSISGGSRAKLRDSLRGEQAKLNKLYGLRDKYLVRKKGTWNRKHTLIFFGVICPVISLVFWLSLGNENTKEEKTIEKTELVDNKIIKAIAPYVETKEILHSELRSKGYTDIGRLNDFYKFIEEEQNRRKLYKFLNKEGYENFLTQLELESYLGYDGVFYKCLIGNITYHVEISMIDKFERDNPNAHIVFINEGNTKIVNISDKDDFLMHNQTFRPEFIFKIKKDYKYSKRRLLYYSLLATGYLSENEIGTISEFIDALSSREKLREFYTNLLDWGFLSSELGDELEFCENISTDFHL